MSEQQQDLFAARKARDNALDTVAENAASYPDRALKCLSDTFAAGAVVTGEDVRIAIEKEIGPPHHHNAWGAIISKAVRSRRLIATGRYVQMRTKKSHARKTPEYCVR